MQLNLEFRASADEIYKHLENICKLGPRVCGSEEDKKAGEYCLNFFKTLGLKTIVDTWDVTVFEEKNVRLKILSPQVKDLTCRALLRSSATPEGGIISEIVYVGDGEEKDYQNRDVTGTIVFIDWPERFGAPHVITLIEIAKQKGAVGFIISSTTPGYIISPWGAHRFGTPIPAISIAVEDALFLREMLKKHTVTGQLKVETKLTKGVAHNVIGILEGAEKPDEFVYVTDHSDTIHTTPGVNDNASGMSIVLEIARLLSKYKPKRSIIFLILSGEEGGCIGASQYVEKYASDLHKIKALINFDISGIGGRLYLIEETNRFPYGFPPARTIKPPDWLLNYIKEVSRELGFTLETRKAFICGDEGPFLDAGVPAIALFGRSDPYYHSEWDDINRKDLDVNSLKVQSEIVATVVWRLANAEKIPP
jgi:aminopeptidase YwaD